MLSEFTTPKLRNLVVNISKFETNWTVDSESATINAFWES